MTAAAISGVVRGVGVLAANPIDRAETPPVTGARIMKWWHGSLIGLGIAGLMILLTLPITLYVAIDKITNELKPASVGVFAFWIAAVVIGTVGGGLVPKLLGSVDRESVSKRQRDQRSRL